MRNLLEIKELIRRFYSKNEVFIVPVLKFLLALVVLLNINKQLGYMARINNIAIVLIAALMCSFLPTGCIILFSALFVLLHLYSLAIEAAVVGFAMFLVMFLLFFRFSPKDSLVVLIIPLLLGLRIPYVMPVAMGLLGAPASAVSIGCGVVAYHLVHFVSLNAPSIKALDANEATARLRMVIDGIISNKEMIVMVAAFAFTVILVYIIRRLSIDHSWTIAMIAGTIMNIVILLIGDLMYDTNVSVVGIIFGSLVSLGLCVVLQFFRFNVDYTRTEKVQFEDDEYYYYVKAVPKMTVAAPEKTVKRINTQIGRSAQQEHAAQGGRSSRVGSAAHQPSRGGRNSQKAAGRQAASRKASASRAAFRREDRDSAADEFEET
ncbi:MAG: hypothetical protein K2I01_04740 [Lachnospiraceae bacterium]|nr:hypothetical protein [Lachnospiraceae bacterium]